MSKKAATAEATPVAAAGLFPKPEQDSSGFRRIVVLMLSLVTAPTVLLLAIGILMLVFYDAQLNVVFGIMVVTLVICLATGSAIALVFLRREATVSQLQSDFVSKVSHELRTPLTSIRMFVETLQRDDVARSRQEECLDALDQETVGVVGKFDHLDDPENGTDVVDVVGSRTSLDCSLDCAAHHQAIRIQYHLVDQELRASGIDEQRR